VARPARACCTAAGIIPVPQIDGYTAGAPGLLLLFIFLLILFLILIFIVLLLFFARPLARAR
jgi:hypothetical protein